MGVIAEGQDGKKKGFREGHQRVTRAEYDYDAFYACVKLSKIQKEIQEDMFLDQWISARGLTRVA